MAKVRCKADEEFLAAHKAKHTTKNTLDVSLLDVLSTPKKEDVKKRCACCLDPRAASPAAVAPTTTPTSSTKLSVDDVNVVYCGTCDAVTETVHSSAVPPVEVEIADDDVAQQSATDDSPAVDGPDAIEDAIVLDTEDTPAVETTGSAVLCRNFRELLWYWQQYYLRRGRDRLSVEFSAHLPFRYWQALVGSFLSLCLLTFTLYVPMLKYCLSFSLCSMLQC